MRQKITYIFKYNLLATLLLAGAICCAVGVTWCRYQKVVESPVNFIIEGPGSFVILGPDEETLMGVWYEDKASKTTRMDFRITNGVEESFSEEDGVFRLRLYVTEGIPANAEAALVVVDEEGIRQTYPRDAEQIIFEGKYLQLCNQMGDGTRYRFMDGDKELVLALEGGKQSMLQCSIVVKGDVEPFLAEMQLIDAAYGDEASILTDHVDKVEETPVFLLPEWISGAEAPATELFLSAQDALTEGKLTVSTESEWVIPTLALTEETDSSESSKATSVSEDVSIEPGKVQGVKLTLQPNEELLKGMTEPVAAKVDVKWAYTNEAGGAEELTAELVVVLKPTEMQLPSEPSDESDEATGESSDESSESSEPGSEVSESSSEASEPSSESDGPSEETSDSSGESSAPNDEISSEPSEENVPSETIPTEDEDVSGEPTEEAIEELSETESFSMITFETSIEAASSEAAESSDFSEATDTSESKNSEESADSGESEESEESVESNQPSSSDESMDSSEPSLSTEETAEENGCTFIVKKQNDKHQMVLTGLVQKLSLTEMISGQVTYIGEEARTTSQELQELHIVSHLATWGFNIPASELVIETMVEGLTSEGYKPVENSPIPAVTIFDVTEGDYAGGKYLTVQGNNALAGTYRLIVTQKTNDNIVLHTEYIPIFINYRFEDALKAEAQEE